MKISSSWLKKYISLPAKFSALIPKFSHCGLEVESIQTRELDTTHLRVAEILEARPHPNADRLSLCRVRTNDGEYGVVCGAKNYRDGDKAILALSGAKLPNGLEIKESKIRGELSQGMLCSETELGFEVESQGIIILPHETSLTADIRKILKLGETVIEFNVTPNRSDWLSFLGIARELSAILRKSITIPVIKIKESVQPIQKKVQVKLKDSKKCPRYMARLITGIRVGPSPDWIKDALESIGLRSINNVVDVTNFVMMEWGQPLHAFDFDRLDCGTILVRHAEHGERIQTLDGEERSLLPQDLLICDASKPVAIAGIMGGTSSEVTDATKNILLESAYFDPISIRKTSKRLGLASESSKRFERGVDVESVPLALDRAASLIQEVAGGEIAKGRMDMYPSKAKSKRVTLSLNRLNAYLGYLVSASEVKGILKRLGFQLKSQKGDHITFHIPSYRRDVESEVDLIEEVARFSGYENIPDLELEGKPNLEQKIPSDYDLADQIRNTMNSMGLSEVINYSFYAPQDLQKLGLSIPTVQIQNPLGEEFSQMRPSLIPSLLKNAAYNFNHQKYDLKLFELGRIYDTEQGEKEMLCGLLSGPRTPPHWSQSHVKIDFFDMKAVVQHLCERMGLKSDKISYLTSSVPSYYQPGQASTVEYQNQSIGYLGKIHHAVEEQFDLKQSVFVFELEGIKIKSFMMDQQQFIPIPKYPTVRRDLSFIVLLESELTYEKIHDTIIKISDELNHWVYQVDLFDTYTGDPIPTGYKSFTYALTYLSKDRTLTDAEINADHQKICDHLIREFHIQIR